VSNKRKQAARAGKAQGAAQLRHSREREEHRRARLIVTAIVAVAVLLVVVAAVAIIPRLDDPGPSPEGITADNGVLYTAADVPNQSPPTGGDGSGSALQPVSVVLYEDFHCPTCKDLQTTAGGYLDTQVGLGAIELEYRPVAILDPASTTDYSTRSANAAACVFEDSGTTTFVNFHNSLFANQPPEGGAGLSNDRLALIAEKIGASPDVASCISNGTYEDWVARATEAASKAGVTGTPTVRVDGKDVLAPNGGSPGLQDIMAAISEARLANQ